MLKRFVVTSALALGIGIGAPQSAQAITFLQFFQDFAEESPWTITNDGAGSTEISADLGITTVIPDTPGVLALCINATCSGFAGVTFGVDMTFTATNTDSATLNGGNISQPYSGSFAITSGGTNILSGTFTDSLFGSEGTGSPTLEASEPPDSVTFTSDIFNVASLGLQRGFSLSFSNWSPVFGIDNGSVASATADATGTFFANSETDLDVVPEPTSMLLLGTGLVGVASRLRRRNKA